MIKEPERNEINETNETNFDIWRTRFKNVREFVPG